MINRSAENIHRIAKRIDPLAGLNHLAADVLGCLAGWLDLFAGFGGLLEEKVLRWSERNKC